MLLKLVRAGYPREEIEKIYKNRFGEAKSIPEDTSPTLGPKSAPITIVEFADFECPFCAMEYPVLDKLVNEDRRDKVRLVYKVKLLGHPHGKIAAQAALAAAAQGKFWEMHHKLFDNQRALEERDLEGYAKAIGLDIAKYRADFKSKAVLDAIEKDQRLSEDLKIEKTPTVYVNGREIEPDAIEDYVAEELGETPKPKAAPSASGAPALSGIPSASAAPPASASASAKPAASAPKGK
jgi:protein-disulfide isomerase